MNGKKFDYTLNYFFSMKQEFVEKMFETIFPEVKVDIISYEVLEKNISNSFAG